MVLVGIQETATASRNSVLLDSLPWNSAFRAMTHGLMATGKGKPFFP